MLMMSKTLSRAIMIVAAFFSASEAFAADSGQRVFAQIVVEPAVDSTTGNTIYVLSPEKAPVPTNVNAGAMAPLFLPLYPLSSTVSAFDLNCLPTNCDHVNVLPFHFAGYDAIPGSSDACRHFNGGQDCSLVKGHDHLIGIPRTGGDSNRICNVQLVVFTQKAFDDGAINTRVKTVDQVNALVANQEAMVVITPISLNCSIVAERTYELGTPVVVAFP